MWHCPKCREKIDDEFDVCWSCGTSRDGVEDPDFQRADDAAPVEDEAVPVQLTAIREAEAEVALPATRATTNRMDCPRCHAVMQFVGTKKFHEGTNWGAWGDLGELFVNKEDFDVYVCKRCGRVEFYVKDIGADLRPRDEG
jgi:predicted nucleic-acid-binding Zn-ribbon protein